jgi:hypothetical protein
MATMHAHDYQHDHSKETDELTDEFRAILRRIRRGASDTLRAHRDRQARLDRARRDQRSTHRDTRTVAREEARDTERMRRDTTTAEKTRVEVVQGRGAGVSPEWIASWAAAHAAADVAREEADAAQDRANEARDSSAAAAAAEAHQRAEVAQTWARSWDDRLRDNGVDPDGLEPDTADTTAEPGRDARDATRGVISDAGVGREADGAELSDGEQFIADWAARAGQQAIDADTILHTDTGPVSASELVAATYWGSPGDSPAPAALPPSLSAVPSLSVDPAVDLDAGAQL